MIKKIKEEIYIYDNLKQAKNGFKEKLKLLTDENLVGTDSYYLNILTTNGIHQQFIYNSLNILEKLCGSKFDYIEVHCSLSENLNLALNKNGKIVYVNRNY